MIDTGINYNLLLVQMLVGFGWIAFSIISLFSLRRKKLSGAALAVWVFVICALPVLGPLAFWIIQPSGETN